MLRKVIFSIRQSPVFLSASAHALRGFFVVCALFGWWPAETQQLRLRRRITEPSGFNQKILYRAAWDRRELLQATADKWSLRAFVEAKAGQEYLPTLYWSGSEVPLVRPSEIPAEFVAKVSHRSGGIVSVKENLEGVATRFESPYSDPRRYSAEPGSFRWDNLAHSMNAWLGRPYAWGGSLCKIPEWAYQGSRRMALFEELLSPRSEPLRDFKFFAFQGRIKLVRVDTPDKRGKTMRHFLPDWTELAVRFWEPGLLYGLTEPAPAKPDNFDEAKELISFLARDFDFVRVDTYIFDGRLIVGEFTHYPTAGRGRFSDPGVDRWLGSEWDLPAAHLQR